jgi:hypothetical protein
MRFDATLAPPSEAKTGCEGRRRLSESEVIESSAGTRDPKVVVAPMLPARTLGHFQAAVRFAEACALGPGR